MVLILFCAAICALAAVGDAATAVVPPDNNPNNPGDCYFKEVGPMKTHEHKPYGDCGQIICNEDRSMSIETCGSYGGKGCSDSSKPYPGCCPKRC